MLEKRPDVAATSGRFSNNVHSLSGQVCMFWCEVVDASGALPVPFGNWRPAESFSTVSGCDSFQNQRHSDPLRGHLVK